MVKNNDNMLNIVLPDSDGNTVDISKLTNKYIIVYFYSKDNTSGCTNQALEYCKLLDEFKALGAVIIGISKDSVESHKRFKNKYDLPITLLSDIDKEFINKYDVFKEKTMYGKKVMGVVRSSFIISNNKFIKVNYNVKGVLDAKSNLEYLKSLS